MSPGTDPCSARQRAGGPGPRSRVAAAELRRRVHGAAPVRLGADRDGRAGHWLLARRPCTPARKASWNWRSSAAGHHARSRCLSWWPWRARGGGGGLLQRSQRTRPAFTITRSASTAPGTGTSPCPCSRTPSSPSPPPMRPAPPDPSRPRGLPHRQKRGPDSCGQIFAPPRTYAPPAFMTDETGRELIPLTAAETRRLFNLHTRATRPAAFHEHWSDWRRYRQASARKSHYARRTRNHETLL